MSKSRRRAATEALEALFTLFGSAARTRLWVDVHSRTGLRCPCCKGKRYGLAEVTQDPEKAFVCSVCWGEGALRPRHPRDGNRMADQEIVDAGDLPVGGRGGGGGSGTFTTAL